MALKRTDLQDQARAPFGKPATSYPTPNIADRFVIEEVPIDPSAYKPIPYRSPHPDYDNNGLILVWQGKVKASNNQIAVIRVYSNNLGNDDWYNYSIHYSGEANATPIYVRSYIDLREDYAALTKGSKLTAVMRLRVTAQGTGYTSVPTVTISSGGGAGATARAIMNPAGTKVIGLELLTAGTGFTSNPTVAFTGGGGTGAAATAEIQPAGAVLVKEETAKLDNEDARMSSLFWKVTRVYEVLPGPWVPFTRYDDDLGPIQGRRRAVLNTDQAASLTVGGKTTYEGREGSSIVSWQIEEAWDDSLFPPKTDDLWDNDRGAVQRVSQLVEKTGLEVATLTASGGIATLIRYEGFNQFLVRQIIETWTLPGPALTSEKVNEDGTLTTTTRTLALASTITEGETIAGGLWTKTSSEPYSDTIRFKVTEVRPLPGNPMVSRSITKDGDVMTETRTLSQASSIATTTVVGGGIWTRTFHEPVSNQVAWKIVQVRTTADENPSYSIEIPDPVPTRFRAVAQVKTTETTEMGEASMPVLAAGDISRSEQQLDQYTYRLRIVSRALTVPVSITQTKITQDGQVATEVETLANGIQTVTPAAGGTTIEGSVENLGNGQSIKRVVSVPGVFTKDTFETEIEDLLPRDFQALLKTRETTEIVAGTATQPVLAVGELSAKEEQISVQLKRVRRKARDIPTLPKALTGKRVLSDGRLATLTRILAAGAQTITPTARTVSAEIDALGDGSTVKTQVQADEALPQASTTQEQPVIPPRKFLTITSDKTVESVVEHVAVSPDPLGINGLGVVESSAKQIEKFRGLKRTRTRAGSIQTTLVEYRQNSKGQLVTKNTSFSTVGTPITVSALTEAAEVEALGDGRFMRKLESVATLFDESVYTIAKEDRTPHEFHRLLPEKTLEQTFASGSSVYPTLAAGQYFGRQHQLTQQTKRVLTRSRALPTGILALPTGKATSTEYGGGRVNTVKELSTTELFPSGETGSPVLSANERAGILSSRVTDLGGQWLKETVTRHHAAWPELYGTEIDETLGVIVPFTTQVVPAGTLGGISGFQHISVRPIDHARSEKTVRTTANAHAALLAYKRSFAGTTNVDLPTELISLVRYKVVGGAAGYDNTTQSPLYNFFTGDNQASIDLKLTGEATASASVIYEVNHKIKQVWGADRPCMHYLFFVPNESGARAAILAALAARFGVSAASWPKFTPTQVSLICRGSRYRGTVSVGVKRADSVRADYAGDVKGISSAAHTQRGASFHADLEVKTTRISPTIHKALVITGDNETPVSFGATSTISGHLLAESNAIVVTANGSVSAEGLEATGIDSNPAFPRATIPTGGLYLHRLNVEPHKDICLKVHAEVVDFADLV